MTMTLRTTTDQDAVLTDAAARAGVSKQAFVLTAALSAASEHSRRRDQFLARIAERDGELLDRLRDQ